MTIKTKGKGRAQATANGKGKPAKAVKAKGGKSAKPAAANAVSTKGLLTQAQLAARAKVSLPTASKYRSQLKSHQVKVSDGRVGVMFRPAAVEALRGLRDGGLSRRGVYERA